jgi:hypothetical protein
MEQLTDTYLLSQSILDYLDKATDPVPFAKLVRVIQSQRSNPADVLAIMSVLTSTPNPLVDVAMMFVHEDTEVMVFALHGRPLPYPGEDWYRTEPPSAER